MVTERKQSVQGPDRQFVAQVGAEVYRIPAVLEKPGPEQGVPVFFLEFPSGDETLFLKFPGPAENEYVEVCDKSFVRIVGTG